MREIEPLDLVETIREGLLVLNPDLTIRFANRAFCDIFAVTQRIRSAGSSMSSATDSGAFPNCAP
jgi:PAS domain-containing protein